MDSRDRGGDLVGDDGLLTYEEINPVPLLATVAAAGLLVTAATMRWVLCKVFRNRVASWTDDQRAEYWRY